MKKFNIEHLIHHFGLDHLEVYGTFKDESLFDRLDFDNSNYSELDEYKITKNEVPKFKYKVIFSKGNYSLFAYYKGLPKTKKQPVATRDYIAIYSTAFKLLEYEEVIYFLEYYLKLFHCRRFDICIDLRINIDELLEGYFEDYNTGRDYKKSGNTETRYFGELKNSKNKRQLIRVYNKILDIFEKRKVNLYQDYLINDNITRIELEVRQELAKNIDYKEVFDNPLLISIFKNYLDKYTKIFEPIQGDKITLFKARDVKLSESEYQSIYYKTGRYNYFVGAAKTLHNLGFCPVRVLILEGLLHEKTKYSLGIEVLEDIFRKEYDAKRRAIENKYTRNNIDEILSNYYKYGS